MKISNKVKMFVATAAVLVASVFAPSAFAAKDDTSDGCPEGWVMKKTCVMIEEDDADLWGIVSTIINFILAIVGVIAVFMIIFGGIQYSTSAGDSGKVKKAKDTILYGIIGLVIALLAAAIVNFVLNGIFSSDGEGEKKGSSIVTTYVA